MSTFFLIALRNIVQARRRTAVLAFALALVTAALVLLLSLSAGISDTLIRARRPCPPDTSTSAASSRRSRATPLRS
ncbi:MAG: hypothetical protein HC923_05185 [Myxococcales bacterium]|nr:hypothetical protein [Myxococcales bacterium]